MRHLEPIRELKEVVIISQSSGLNIWKKFMKISNFQNENIKIFALGAFAKGYGRIKNTLVFKGSFDIYSWLLDFHKTDVIVKCGHMGYFKSKDVQEKIEEYLKNNNSKISWEEF